MGKCAAVQRRIQEQGRGIRTSSASIRSRARQVVLAIIIVATEETASTEQPLGSSIQ